MINVHHRTQYVTGMYFRFCIRPWSVDSFNGRSTNAIEKKSSGEQKQMGAHFFLIPQAYCVWTLKVETWTCAFLPDRLTPTFQEKKIPFLTDRPTGQNKLVINLPFKESAYCCLTFGRFLKTK